MTLVPFRWLVALTCAGLMSGMALAQDDKRTERIQFKKGATSAIVEGRIRGRQSVDYLIRARRGQSVNISLATAHTATYFNILAPGQREATVFNGSTGQNQFEGVLAQEGDYRVRVYMMDSAGRRDEAARYRLEVVIGASAIGGQAPSTDAKVAGTDFHATGELTCAMGGQPGGTCAFGVKRGSQGNGLVEVTKPDGSKRVIVFQRGRATGYEGSQAVRSPFKASRQGDLTIVDIGDERYEIPDIVINGG
ncbi:MAG: hypothetical protein ACK5OA_15655 [Acidovorax sp.]|jgi:hypothetical protein